MLFRSRLLISWLQSPSAVILEPKKIKSDTVSTVSPSISHEVMGPDAMILVYLHLMVYQIPNILLFNLILMKMKEESEKVGLKLNIQKTKIMVSGPITSWEIDGETVETVSDFIFLGSKITADEDCSHEIKRHLLLGRKVMFNLESIFQAETLLCQQRSIWSRLWFFLWSCMDVRVGM